MFASGNTTLVISNKEMKDITNIFKYLEDSGLLLKDFSKTTKNEAKEQKWGFLEMLWSTLGASFIANLLTGKGTIRAGENFWCYPIL